jgi:hypothetical protein
MAWKAADGIRTHDVQLGNSVLARGVPPQWGSLLLMFAAILAAGLLSSVAALIPTLRAPLLRALRSE